MRLWYFDRQGKQISLEQRCELLEDEAYRRVDYTQVTDESFVSTIWTGEDSNVTMALALAGDVSGSDSPPFAPCIFETMTFHNGKYVHQQRHCTELEAHAGHQLAVHMLKTTLAKTVIN